ncbi:unnamed protein product [Polarella glacialis]|uniref:Uncharacterized protein n=1 Tax=Polarella glacialis TaxID=89957 RepID=A0A813E370_POLGL|nr:unnamed protein product [Polarella glacialis]
MQQVRCQCPLLQEINLERGHAACGMISQDPRGRQNMTKAVSWRRGCCWHLRFMLQKVLQHQRPQSGQIDDEEDAISTSQCSMFDAVRLLQRSAAAEFVDVSRS